MNTKILIAALGAASLAMNGSPGAVADSGAAPERQQVQSLTAAPPGPQIEAGTPEIYRRPYLSDHTPVAIYRDGRQVYDSVPMMARQADGTMRQVAARVVIEPATPAPVEPAGALAVVR